VISASEVRTWLCLQDEDTGTIRTLIARATSTLERMLGGIYLGEPTTREDLFCGGTDRLSLDQTPTDGVVTVSTRRDVFDEWAVLDTADWRLDGWHIYHRTCFPWGRLSVKVSYPVGWATGEGPQELQQLVKEMVGMAWASHDAGINGNMRSETLGDYSYTRGNVENLAAWQAVATRWMRLRV
jgi:hypothetical protein